MACEKPGAAIVVAISNKKQRAFLLNFFPKTLIAVRRANERCDPNKDHGYCTWRRLGAEAPPSMGTQRTDRSSSHGSRVNGTLLL